MFLSSTFCNVTYKLTQSITSNVLGNNFLHKKYKLSFCTNGTNLIDEPRLWILQTSEGRIRDTKGTANSRQ